MFSRLLQGSQVPRSHVVEINKTATKLKKDDSSPKSTRQRIDINRNKGKLHQNSTTFSSDTRHKKPENDINFVNIDQRFARKSSEIPESAINQGQHFNHKPLSDGSQGSGTERYIEIINNQNDVSFYKHKSLREYDSKIMFNYCCSFPNLTIQDNQSTSSSNSSEGTIYNDVVNTGTSRHNSVGSENTVYNDVIAISRQASISSDNTLYNDVIEDASQQDNSSISSDDTIYNDVII